MVVYPNDKCELFCYWMLFVSWQKLTPPRSLVIKDVYTAAIAKTSVSQNTWDNFTQVTAWRAPFFEIWRDYSSVYSPTAVAYFAALSPQPSLTWKTQINDFINAVIASGSLAKLEYLYLFATEHEQHSTINIINPAVGTILAVNSPTFTTMFGYTGNGSNAYLQTYINMAATTIFTQNSNTSGIYIRSNVAENKCDFGGGGGNYSAFYSRNGADLAVGHNYSSGSDSVANTDSRGLLGMQRNSSTQFLIHKNGAQLGATLSATTGASGTNTMQVLNAAGTSLFSSKQVSAFYMGSGALSFASMYTDLQALAVVQGWNV